MRPGPRTLGPDVRADLQIGGIVERARAHPEELRRRLAVTVEVRAAVAAEVTDERAAAVGFLGIVLRCALGELEAIARDEGGHRAMRSGGALAIDAMAGAQLGDRRADGIADGAAKAAAGAGRGHGNLLEFRVRALIIGRPPPKRTRVQGEIIGAAATIRQTRTL